MNGERLTERHWPGLPAQHLVELFRSSELPPANLTGSAFVLLFDAADRLLLTHVDKVDRGWDVPGGHLESGEDAAAAAVRELAEETGYRLSPAVLTVTGWFRITVHGAPPPNYRYPTPVSYMVGFTARIPVRAPRVAPAPGAECSVADWCTPAEADRRCPDADWLSLIELSGRVDIADRLEAEATQPPLRP